MQLNPPQRVVGASEEGDDLVIRQRLRVGDVRGEKVHHSFHVKLQEGVCVCVNVSVCVLMCLCGC